MVESVKEFSLLHAVTMCECLHQLHQCCRLWTCHWHMIPRNTFMRNVQAYLILSSCISVSAKVANVIYQYIITKHTFQESGWIPLNPLVFTIICSPVREILCRDACCWAQYSIESPSLTIKDGEKQAQTYIDTFVNDFCCLRLVSFHIISSLHVWPLLFSHHCD